MSNHSVDSEDRISVIQWANKKTGTVDQNLHLDSPTECAESESQDDVDDECTSTDSQASNNAESDVDDDVEVIGEYPPSSTRAQNILPPFFQLAPWGQYCSYNPYFQYSPYVQKSRLALDLSHTQQWLQSQSQYNRANHSHYNRSRANHIRNLIALALRAHILRRRPNVECSAPCPSTITTISNTTEAARVNPNFQVLMEVPDKDYIEAKVYHLDKTDGVLSYKCKTCDGLVRRGTKARKLHAVNETKYDCSSCAKTFNTCKQLQSHLFRHSEKKYKCHFCSKKFLTKSEMTNHVNTHTGQKPFKCPACTSTFAQSSRYYAHIREYHKKYQCEKCVSQLLR